MPSKVLAPPVKDVGAIRAYDLCHFSEHFPNKIESPSSNNRDWCQVEKFSDLGDTLAYFLVSSINHEAHTLEFKSRLDERTRSLGFWNLFVKGNYAKFERRTYSHKRFVRLGFQGYHPNSFGVSFEVAYTPPKNDVVIRDKTDIEFQSLSFPETPRRLHCSLGFSAIKYADEYGRWSMDSSSFEEHVVSNDFHLAKTGFVGLLEQVQLRFPNTKTHEIVNNRVIRKRISFPLLDPEVDEWNSYGMIDCINFVVSEYIQLVKVMLSGATERTSSDVK